MKKIKIGVSRDIDFKIKKFKKNVIISKISEKKDYNALIITAKTEIDHKFINSCKKIKILFIMSLHLLTKIKIEKIRDDIKILYFDKKSRLILNNITPTPEFIFGLIILLTKNFLKSLEFSKKNQWKPKETAEFSFNKMLSQSTLGIIGYGRIGKKLNAIAKSFRMKTIIFTRKNNIKLTTVAKKSDIITINLSLNKQTKNMINRKFFARMKNNSYFINTSKGEIVNYNDLIKHLKKNINSAAIDVYKNENRNDKEVINLIKLSKQNNKLILTPHIAGSTLDSITTLQKHCLDRIVSDINI